nr:hypothetical protein [Brevibacillus sp. AY1]
MRIPKNHSQDKARWFARDAEGARRGRGASLVRHAAEPLAWHLRLFAKKIGDLTSRLREIWEDTGMATAKFREERKS